MGGTIIPITSYFGVQLCVGNPNKKEEDLKELKLAGSLEMCETGQGVKSMTSLLLLRLGERKELE